MIDERLERQVELFISWLLRIGVMTSGALLVLGIVLTFQHHPLYRSSSTDLAALTSIHGEYPHTVSSVLQSAREGKGQGVAMLGLLLLIATPVFRVAVSIVLFARERDLLFVAITTTVLALLLLSFALGAAGG
ncbi:MAG: DUF1634 domain-containing protein [Acidobacteriota bacterium]